MFRLFTERTANTMSILIIIDDNDNIDDDETIKTNILQRIIIVYKSASTQLNGRSRFISGKRLALLAV